MEPKTFDATDADGNPCKIQEVFEQGIVFKAGVPDHRYDGRLQTDDGRHVNRIGKGVYEFIGGDEIVPVTSTDPNAP